MERVVIENNAFGKKDEKPVQIIPIMPLPNVLDANGDPMVVGGGVGKGGIGKGKVSAGKSIKNSTETQSSVDKKLTTYLLDKDHPIGGSKAEWFDSALGFNKTNSGVLAKQIVFDPSKAAKTSETQFGVKYDQTIQVTGANGRTIDVKFGWIKNNDGVVRLVTAIPTKK